MIIMPLMIGGGHYPRPMNHRYRVEWDCLGTGDYDDWRSFRTKWRAKSELRYFRKYYPESHSRIIDSKEKR